MGSNRREDKEDIRKFIIEDKEEMIWKMEKKKIEKKLEELLKEIIIEETKKRKEDTFKSEEDKKGK